MTSNKSTDSHGPLLSSLSFLFSSLPFYPSHPVTSDNLHSMYVCTVLVHNHPPVERQQRLTQSKLHTSPHLDHRQTTANPPHFLECDALQRSLVLLLWPWLSRSKANEPRPKYPAVFHLIISFFILSWSPRVETSIQIKIISFLLSSSLVFIFFN